MEENKVSEVTKILEMLEKNLITIEEAERLIKAVSESKEKEQKSEKKWRSPDFQELAQEIGHAVESIQIGKFLDNFATKIRSSISTGFGTVAGTYVDESIDADGIEELKIKQTGGSVTVHKTDVQQFTVKGMRRNSKIEEGTLTLTSGGGNFSVGVPSTVKNIEVEVGSGNATISNVNAEKIKSETTGGNLSISNVSGSISVESMGGNVNMSDVNSTDIYAKSIGGRIQLIMEKLVEGQVRLDSTAGEIKLFVTEDSAFDLDAEVIGGDFKTDLQLEMLENGPVKYSAKYNEGAASVSIKARHGDVEVSKR
jgi:DUF4097 and DUF4098 domain-containing protein YvlB